MAGLNKHLKQRIAGALVLLALAVIFLPMLFSRPDDVRQVRVDAPPMPETTLMPSTELEPVVVPEPEPLPDEPLEIAPAVTAELPATSVAKPEVPVAAKVPVQTAAKVSVPDSKPASAPKSASRLDANTLPVTWSVQLASLSSAAGADELQKKLRSKGYNAYIRRADGKNRVFVGPVIERAEADRLVGQLNRQFELKGFVTRFQPE